MERVFSPGLSQKDILFLVETVDPTLLNKIDTIKGDPAIIEGMMDHEAHRIFERIMLMAEETIMATVSPRLIFEVLLRITYSELNGKAYTVERTSTQKIPVFDTSEVIHFLDNKPILRYLADMLTSFTRSNSFTRRVRIREGIWRKIKFSDMNIDSLLMLCQSRDEEHRFSLYKRIADLCLFILGIFPEYVTIDYRYPSSSVMNPRSFSRFKRSMEDYEEEGRLFYKLAGEHREAKLLNLAEVFHLLHNNFNLAKKPLNFISQHFIKFKNRGIFPSVY